MQSEHDGNLEGGCACGSVRYRLTTLPMFVNCCHCRWCQRESGAAFALNAVIEADRVVLLAGRPEIVDTPSLSGAGQKFHRCPECRIALWSNYAGSGEAIHFIRVGTLDDPDRLPPGAHIFTASKQPWLVLPADGLVFEDYYDLDAVWPAASLQRRKAALA